MDEVLPFTYRRELELVCLYGVRIPASFCREASKILNTHIGIRKSYPHLKRIKSIGVTQDGEKTEENNRFNGAAVMLLLGETPVSGRFSYSISIVRLALGCFCIAISIFECLGNPGRAH